MEADDLRQPNSDSTRGCGKSVGGKSVGGKSVGGKSVGGKSIGAPPERKGGRSGTANDSDSSSGSEESSSEEDSVEYTDSSGDDSEWLVDDSHSSPWRRYLADAE
jgi:hypothetical protein